MLVFSAPGDPLGGACLEYRGAEMISEGPGGCPGSVALGDRLAGEPDVFGEDGRADAGRQLGFGEQVQVGAVDEIAPIACGDGGWGDRLARRGVGNDFAGTGLGAQGGLSRGGGRAPRGSIPEEAGAVLDHSSNRAVAGMPRVRAVGRVGID